MPACQYKVIIVKTRKLTLKDINLAVMNLFLLVTTLGKLVTEKPVDFVGFDNVVEFNKNRQNDDNVVKTYKS